MPPPNPWPCELQIAPAEGPDVSERMVIITGPPEAQFKVSARDHLGYTAACGSPHCPQSLWSLAHRHHLYKPSLQHCLVSASAFLLLRLGPLPLCFSHGEASLHP